MQILAIEYHLVLPDVVQELRRRGHQVTVLPVSDIHVASFQRAVRDVELVFGVNYSPPIATLCGMFETPYASWTVDPLPLSRVKSAPRVRTDLCLAYAHSDSMLNALGRLGLDVSFLPLACDPNRRRRLDDSSLFAPYTCDVSFVGNSLISEAASLDAFLIKYGGNELSVHAMEWGSAMIREPLFLEHFNGLEWLGGAEALPEWLREQVPVAVHDKLVEYCDGLLSWLYRKQVVGSLSRVDGTVRLYGDAGWTDNPGFQGSADGGDELTSIYNASRINLDVPRLYQRNICTLRIFEILACHGFLLSQRNEAVNRLFTPGKDFAVYEGPEDIHPTIEWWLKHDDARAEVAEVGHDHVMQHHTIGHRVDVILEAVHQRGWFTNH